MKNSQQNSGPSGWPYRVQMKSTLSTGWSATLFREQVAIARVTGHPQAGEVQDLRFDQPEREAAFLTWLNGVRLPKGVDRTPEAVVHTMMLQATTAGSAQYAPSPAGEEVETELLALFGPPLVESTCRPLPLHTACSQAMQARGVGEGEDVNLLYTHNDAGSELVELGLLLLIDDPKRFTTEAAQSSFNHLLTLLAALGVAFEHTSTGRMRGGEQNRLNDMVHGLLGVEATVLSLTVEDGCPHAVLLRTICLNAQLAHVSLPYDQDDENDLLMLIVAFIQTLAVICDMDVNAVLSDHLSQYKGKTKTKAHPALKP